LQESSASPLEWKGAQDLPREPLDFGPQHFDPVLCIEHISGPQQSQCSLPDQDGQHTGTAQSVLTVGQKSDVVDRGIEMRSGLVDV
jgi:hypothetical protein